MSKDTPNSDREIVISAIRAKGDEIMRLGATSLYLFGSRARGDHRPDSDLDVFVDYVPGSGFSLVRLAGIQRIVRAATGLEVHITTRNSFAPARRTSIEQQAVRVF